MADIKEKQDAVVQKFMHDMHEFGVDAMQIVFSTLEPDGTLMGRFGFGNYYARIGMIQKWLLMDDAEDNAKEFALKMKDNDHGGY